MLLSIFKMYHRFMVEFSLTKPEKPIPVGTVRVYFTCKSDDQLSITFRFEKDSLIHSVDKTIRHKEIEVYQFLLFRNGLMMRWQKSYWYVELYFIWAPLMKKQELRMKGWINC